MNAEHKQKWINALRSGKYKQVHGVLERGGDLCCLGVFCIANDIPLYDDDGFGSYRTISPMFEPKTQEKFIEMNDIKKMSFSEIADYIEKNL